MGSIPQIWFIASGSVTFLLAIGYSLSILLLLQVSAPLSWSAMSIASSVSRLRWVSGLCRIVFSSQNGWRFGEDPRDPGKWDVISVDPPSLSSLLGFIPFSQASLFNTLSTACYEKRGAMSKPLRRGISTYRDGRRLMSVSAYKENSDMV
ncbi:hypothetical protein EDD18DRAFT_430972 [Armillaria luteobubalina]|uniref:Uncharacterized protein n=1 Tax=Armillaria luteobubalina TaxID=153913 RepID=A0AA39UQL8_9AGAR|nr:hypothetical protein EDD18DRAFT_430972 [Armillaria luteobubalina]